MALARPHFTRSCLRGLRDVADQLTEEDAVGEGTGIMEIRGPPASPSFSGKEADFLGVLPARRAWGEDWEAGEHRLGTSPRRRRRGVPPGGSTSRRSWHGGGRGAPGGAPPIPLLNTTTWGQGEGF